jgi:NaMN:DMB phosphoribosyltransferase
MAALFPLGRVVATPGALERFGPAVIAILLDRHASGNWGELSSLDRRENEQALERGERIFSAYETPLGRCWIVTE